MTDKPIKVLVVDDEENILDVSQRLIQVKLGLQTIGATDGEDAMMLFLEHRPRILVLDVHLDDSKLSGIDILREAKKMDPSVKVIMLTRITDGPVIEEAKKLGADAYLLKPLDTKEWLSVVKDMAQQLS